jgi:hypothetical protein
MVLASAHEGFCAFNVSAAATHAATVSNGIWVTLGPPTPATAMMISHTAGVMRSPVPWMVAILRPAIEPYRLLGYWILEPELLCRALGIVIVAEVSGVLVGVRSTLRKGDDVIDDGGEADDAFCLAVLAEVVGALEPAVTLTLACPATKTRGRAARPGYRA